MPGELIELRVVETPAANSDDCYAAARWTLGDGSAASGLHAAHHYGTAGSYSAAVETTIDGRRFTAEAMVRVACPSPDVTLDFSGQDSGCTRATVCDGSLLCQLRETIRFRIVPRSDVSSPECATYDWDFGDGERAEAIGDPEHPYDVTADIVTLSSGGAVVDRAPIRFQDDERVPPSETFGDLVIRYRGEPGGCGNDVPAKLCRPNEVVVFTLTGGCGDRCESIRWLLPDGWRDGNVVEETFAAGKHAVHAIATVRGRVFTATTSIRVDCKQHRGKCPPRKRMKKR